MLNLLTARQRAASLAMQAQNFTEFLLEHALSTLRIFTVISKNTFVKNWESEQAWVESKP